MSVLEEMIAPDPAGAVAQLPARAARCAPDKPISIYQVHLPSWMRVPEEQNRPLTFSELAPKLAAHLTRLHFTHVQLHSPCYADPEGLEFLADFLHQRDLGVILETAAPPNHADKFNADGSHADGQCAHGETRLCQHDYKWDAAWEAETAAYFGLDPIQRKSRQSYFTRRDDCAFSANYILALSNTLVSRPRPSLYNLMPGDVWQKFANLRLLFAYQYLLPGKKLLFMGHEFGQQNPWRPETSLDWHLVGEGNFHGQLMDWVAQLNWSYRNERAIHQTDASPSGFQWIDTSDAACSVIAFLRRSADTREILLAVLNFTPVPRHNYRIGVPKGGFWSETLNSDALEFGGSGQGNLGGVEAAPLGWNFQSHSLMLTLPPLGAVIFRAPS